MAQTKQARRQRADVPVAPTPEIRGTGQLVLKIEQAPDVPEAEAELQPLFYRGVTYMMPASVVRAPLPTFTFRHLDKVGMFALEGNRAKVLSSLQRAISSAIDAPSLIKIAAVAHSEESPEHARIALEKALKVSKRDAETQQLVHTSARTLGYPLQ